MLGRWWRRWDSGRGGQWDGGGGDGTVVEAMGQWWSRWDDGGGDGTVVEAMGGVIKHDGGSSERMVVAV
ncbi:hypothetical protein Tco_1571661 [Tanacetum coccineum]